MSLLPQEENHYKGVVFLREGATLEGGPECVHDTDTQGR